MKDDESTKFERDLETRFAEMTGLLIRKRAAYGTTNLEMFGGMGIVVRANDKVQRLAQMYMRQSEIAGDGELMEDAWRDLLGYAVLGLQMHLDTREDGE